MKMQLFTFTLQRCTFWDPESETGERAKQVSGSFGRTVRGSRKEPQGETSGTGQKLRGAATLPFG